MVEGGLIIGADGENLRLCLTEFLDTSLVSGEFFGSATGEGCREKGEYNRLLAPEV